MQRSLRSALNCCVSSTQTTEDCNPTNEGTSYYRALKAVLLVASHVVLPLPVRLAAPPPVGCLGSLTLEKSDPSLSDHVLGSSADTAERDDTGAGAADPAAPPGERQSAATVAKQHGVRLQKTRNILRRTKFVLADEKVQRPRRSEFVRVTKALIPPSHKIFRKCAVADCCCHGNKTTAEGATYRWARVAPSGGAPPSHPSGSASELPATKRRH